jgi:hypothetical protein
VVVVAVKGLGEQQVQEDLVSVDLVALTLLEVMV